MLFKSDASNNLICGSTNLIECISIHNRINVFLLSSSQTVHSSICLVHDLSFPVLNWCKITVMFHVRIVPSYDPLTNKFSSTNKFVTFFVWPMNSFRTSPSFVQFQFTIVPSSKLPNNVFSVKHAETNSSFTCSFSYYYYLLSVLLSCLTCLTLRKQLLLTSLTFLSAFCRARLWLWFIFLRDPILNTYSDTSDRSVLRDRVKHVSLFSIRRKQRYNRFFVTLKPVLESSRFDNLHNIKLTMNYIYFQINDFQITKEGNRDS